MEEKVIKSLLGKLRQPIHVEYISKYILKTSMSETTDVLNKLIQEEIIEESEYAKNYYVIKNK